MIRVLVVDDSTVMQELLTFVLESDPEIQVVGVASNGDAAIHAVATLKPDVITMDIHMPRMDGFDATRRIMETMPTPIVIVTGSYNANDAFNSFRAIESGALCLLHKPSGIGNPQHAENVRELVSMVKLMSEVKTVRQLTRVSPNSELPNLNIREWRSGSRRMRCVVIGASTGGPAVLQTIVSALPKNFPVPILVVQHMATGFIDSFAVWFSKTSGFPCRVAHQGEELLPGTVYFGPDGHHMQLEERNKVFLSNDCLKKGLCPSVARLFRSTIRVFGGDAVGVLLTGMGIDGAQELKLMRDCGAVTVAQNRESCIVYGMPGEAVRLKAAEYVLDPAGIAALLTRLAKLGNCE